MTGRPRPHRSHGGWATLIVVAAMASVLVAPSHAATPEPDGTLFTSTRRPYTLQLPAGWRVVPASQEPSFQCCDVFETEGVVARVNSGDVPPDATVEQRVAGNRALDAAEGACTSDPTADRATTLGGTHAIAWARRCPTLYQAIVQAVRDSVSYHLEVATPLDSSAEAERFSELFRRSFAFVDAAASPAVDLTAIDNALQGTWVTEWAPIELGFAAVRAAGLDPADGDPGFAEWYRSNPTGTVRTGVRFDAGDVTQYSALNGGPLEVGWFGKYRLLDADTIEATETGTFNRITYDFALRDDVLSIDVVSDAGGDADLVPQTAIYETLPFTKVP